MHEWSNIHHYPLLRNPLHLPHVVCSFGTVKTTYKLNPKKNRKIIKYIHTKKKKEKEKEKEKGNPRIPSKDISFMCWWSMIALLSITSSCLSI